MASRVRELIRTLMRRINPTRLGIGQVIQEREQAEARRRLSDQAERLREMPRESTQTADLAPSVPDHLSSHRTRGR